MISWTRLGNCLWPNGTNNLAENFNNCIKKLNEQSRDLELEVKECSEEVGEVTALGGSGFRFVVNLLDRTCSCRQWQVSGIPCRHAIAFITSLSNAALDNYVDPYYSVDKFRVAYAQLIDQCSTDTDTERQSIELSVFSRASSYPCPLKQIYLLIYSLKLSSAH